MVRVTISERARRYGYLIWPKTLDDAVGQELGARATVSVVLEGKTLGEKRVDWGNRRISLGPKQTRNLPPTATTFEVSLSRDGMLVVRCC